MSLNLMFPHRHTIPVSPFFASWKFVLGIYAILLSYYTRAKQMEVEKYKEALW